MKPQIVQRRGRFVRQKIVEKHKCCTWAQARAHTTMCQTAKALCFGQSCLKQARFQNGTKSKGQGQIGGSSCIKFHERIPCVLPRLCS